MINPTPIPLSISLHPIVSSDTNPHQIALVVDDNEMNRSVLSRRLAKDGHQVITAEDGVEALKILEAHRIDIVLLDYMMPKMSGQEVLKRIKMNAAWDHIPVIMISAGNEIEKVAECIELGAEDYLTKPFNPILLKARLQASLEKKILRDKEKAYLQQIQANQAQIIMQQKLSSIGELTAGIAYEIKNPLNYIKNFSELTAELADTLRTSIEVRREDIPLDCIDNFSELAQNIRANAEKIVSHSNRADQIIKFMLTLARPAKNEWQRDNIHQLIDQAIFFAYHVSKGRFEHFAPHIDKVYSASNADTYVISQEICQVFLSIIDNAFYSLYHKKKRLKNSFSPVLTITTHDRPGYFSILFRDNGEGIPDDVRDRIFDPFFTTKLDIHAMGLGLSLAQEAIQNKHQGRLKVRSEVGEWTEFIVEIPKNIPSSNLSLSPL